MRQESPRRATATSTADLSKRSPGRDLLVDDIRAFYQEGDRDFSGAKLKGGDLGQADLRGASFRDADLRGCRLDNANLVDVDFTRADLAADPSRRRPKATTLKGAVLEGAQFWDADLSDADLTDAEGLDAGALAGANLHRAKLSPSQWPPEIIAQTNDAIKGCRAIFVTLLAACFYALLTIAATSDANLIMTYGSSELPFLSAPVTLKTFYYTAPLFLLLLFVYFHIYLQRLFEKMATFPAILPDGRGLDEACHTWLLGGLIREQFHHLKQRPLTYRRLSFVSSRFSAWWLAPLCIGAMWWRALVAFDPLLTYVQAAIFTIAVILAARFRYVGAQTLATHAPKPAPRGLMLFVGLVVVVPTILISELYIPTGSINVPPEADFRGRSLIAKRLSDGKFALARFDHAELQQSRLDRSVLKGASFIRANLYLTKAIEADLRDAVLSRANLEQADLSRANLNLTDFSRANLFNATMQDATAKSANFAEADMRYAELSNADLFHANLAEADLLCADLHMAQLKRAILTDAMLNGANLKGVDLQLADLTGALFKQTILTGAKNLDAAIGLTADQLKEACGGGTITVTIDGNTEIRSLPSCKSRCPSKKGQATAHLKGVMP